MSAAISPRQQLETATCVVCQCQSPLIDYFRKTGKGRVCPRCLTTAASKELLKSFGILLAGGAFLALIGGRVLGPGRWQLLLNLLLMAPLLWLTILGHEALHGAAAWLLLGRVYELSLGGGKLWRSFDWRGTRFSLRGGLFMGYCLAAFPHRHRIRLRWGIFVIAPLAVQFLLIVWLLTATDMQRLLRQTAWLEVLLLVNVFIVTVNLFPLKLNAVLATDGYQLWKLIRQKQQGDDLHAQYFGLESMCDHEREDYIAMLDVTQRGLDLYPGNDLLKNQHAAAYLLMDRNVEALACYEQFLTQTSAEIPSVARATYLCNRAAALFALALEPDGIGPEQMACAHSSAEEAYFLVPWVDAAEVVRALSNHYQGRHHLAIRQLREILSREEKPSRRAGLLSIIALAQIALLQIDAAQASLAEAWRIYPKGGRTMARVDELLKRGADSQPAPALP